MYSYDTMITAIRVKMAMMKLLSGSMQSVLAVLPRFGVTVPGGQTVQREAPLLSEYDEMGHSEQSKRPKPSAYRPTGHGIGSFRPPEGVK